MDAALMVSFLLLSSQLRVQKLSLLSFLQIQVSLPLLALVLVLLSFPQHASLSGEADSASGRVSAAKGPRTLRSLREENSAVKVVAIKSFNLINYRIFN